jgi:hypothetical protein
VAGLSPRTGADLGLMRRSGTRVGGFDLTFSASLCRIPHKLGYAE